MAKRDYATLASGIIDGVGGEENVDHVIHCVTRLRFYLKDKDKANTEQIKHLNGVAGAVYNESLGQYQVVIGQAVEDVYEQVVDQLGDAVIDDEADEVKGDKVVQEPTGQSKKNPVLVAFQALVGTITGAMIPIIGLLAAGGMINGLLTLMSEPTLLNWINSSSDTYVILSSMAMAPFYFLPVLVGFSAAKQLKSDPYVVAAIGGLMIHPSVINLTSAHIVNGKIVTPPLLGNLFGVPLNATYLGIPINIPNYAYTIFPIIFAAWLARPVGNWLKDHLPLALRPILQPMITLFVVGSAVLILVGPVVSVLSSGITALITALLNLNLGIASIIIGGLYQVLVIFGLHWMVIPVLTQQIAETGQSNINMIVSFTMLAQGTGALAVFFKTKKEELKALSGSGALSAFAGVTEPAMYGVNLKYGRIFMMSSIGAAVGAGVAGFMHLHMYGFSGSLIGFPNFASPKDNPNNFLIFWIATGVTMLVSFILVYFFGYKDTDVETDGVQKKNVFKDAVGK
ncbi:MAG: PTS transporter subunit EIIC [Lactobacillaceae bacterium]|nr:PTS transporter subunit EIIC [Lactobacillaceae bacterium]